MEDSSAEINIRLSQEKDSLMDMMHSQIRRAEILQPVTELYLKYQ